MATNKSYVNIENAGALSRLINWNGNVESTEVGLLALTFPAVGADGDPTFIKYFAVDTLTEWNWVGGQTNPETGNSWFRASAGDEVVLNLPTPPIDTWDYDALVTGVAPTSVGANIKFATWVDSNYKTHFYTYDKNTGFFAEVTTNKFEKIATTETTVAGIQAISPLRAHTIYYNTATGQEFLVDEGSNVTVISGMYKVGSIEFKLKSLTANTPFIFDINDVALINVQDEEVATSTLDEGAMTSRLLLAGISVLDATNNEALNTASYQILPISVSTFSLTVNDNTDVIVLYEGLLKKI